MRFARVSHRTVLRNKSDQRLTGLLFDDVRSGHFDASLIVVYGEL